MVFFNGQVKGLSVDELKELVLDQFTEAFDRIIQIEKDQAKEIKDLKSKDSNHTNKIEFLIQQVEDLKKELGQQADQFESKEQEFQGTYIQSRMCNIINIITMKPK